MLILIIEQLIFSLVKYNSYSHAVLTNSVRWKNRHLPIPLVSKTIKILIEMKHFCYTLHVLLYILCEIKLDFMKADKYLKSIF